jgi:hypothetical protein
MTTLVLFQGMCPMCVGMGLGMILLWVLVIVAIIAVVWLLLRRSRR